MKNANISTSVDVKLGHGDIVEIMIEEQKEKKEAENFNMSQKIGGLAKKYEDTKTKVEESIIKSNGVKNDPLYKRFIKGVKALNLQSKESIHVRFRQESVGYFSYISLVNLENHKNPITSLKREISKYQRDSSSTCHGNTKSHYVNIPETVVVDLVAYSSDLQEKFEVKFANITHLKINSAAQKQIDQLKAIAEEWLELDEKLYNLEKELFIIEHDTVRNRSKFVKGMLNNSESGKELVALMDTIQANNALQIGTKK